jgi:hypothetical protein
MKEVLSGGRSRDLFTDFKSGNLEVAAPGVLKQDVTALGPGVRIVGKHEPDRAGRIHAGVPELVTGAARSTV